MTRTSPQEFFTLLKWLDGRPLLDVLMEYQLREIDESFWTFTSDGTPQHLRVLLMRAKKNAKTLTGVLVALWLLLVWKAWGNRGNQVFFVASDQGQANDDLDLAKKLIRCNPVLQREVTLKANRIERKDGEGFIEILPAGDADGLHGKTYLGLIVDEFHTQQNYRVLEALELDRTRPDARQVFLSYASPYRHAGVPLVDMLKQHEAGTDDRLYVACHAGSVEDANPSLNGPLGPTRADIEQARRSLPSWVFRRLYLNLPGAPDGAAFDSTMVEHAMVPGRTVLPPHDGQTYIGFVDMSGGSADDATLAIAHRVDGRGVLDLLIDQGPRHGTFDPTAAVAKFAAVLQHYRVTSITSDRYAAEWPVKAFEAHGIVCRQTEWSKSDLYAALEPLLNSGSIDMLDLPKLLQQLIGLVRRGTKIDHAAGEHDDHANAAAGALVTVLATGVPLTLDQLKEATLNISSFGKDILEHREAEEFSKEFWEARGFHDRSDRWTW